MPSALVQSPGHNPDFAPYPNDWPWDLEPVDETLPPGPLYSTHWPESAFLPAGRSKEEPSPWQLLSSDLRLVLLENIVGWEDFQAVRHACPDTFRLTSAATSPFFDRFWSQIATPLEGEGYFRGRFEEILQLTPPSDCVYYGTLLKRFRTRRVLDTSTETPFQDRKSALAVLKKLHEARSLLKGDPEAYDVADKEYHADSLLLRVETCQRINLRRFIWRVFQGFKTGSGYTQPALSTYTLRVYQASGFEGRDPVEGLHRAISIYSRQFDAYIQALDYDLGRAVSSSRLACPAACRCRVRCRPRWQWDDFSHHGLAEEHLREMHEVLVALRRVEQSGVWTRIRDFERKQSEEPTRKRDILLYNMRRERHGHHFTGDSVWDTPYQEFLRDVALPFITKLFAATRYYRAAELSSEEERISRALANPNLAWSFPLGGILDTNDLPRNYRIPMDWRPSLFLDVQLGEVARDIRAFRRSFDEMENGMRMIRTWARKRDRRMKRKGLVPDFPYF